MKHFAFLLLFTTGIAAEPATPFFAMDTIARGGPDTVVPLLKGLGYDGLGGAAGDGRMAQALKDAGLRFFNGYITLSFEESQPALDDRLRGVLDHAGSRHGAVARLAEGAVGRQALREIVSAGR